MVPTIAFSVFEAKMSSSANGNAKYHRGVIHKRRDQHWTSLYTWLQFSVLTKTSLENLFTVQVIIIIQDTFCVAEPYA